MEDDASILAEGTRVEILQRQIGLVLARTSGTIAQAADFPGYYLVDLDAPAHYSVATPFGGTETRTIWRLRLPRSHMRVLAADE